MPILVTISSCDVKVTEDRLSKQVPLSFCEREQRHGTSKLAMVMSFIT